MRDAHPSLLRGTLWLAAGLLGGLCLAPQPASTQSEVSSAELEGLAKRVEVLEARLGGEAAKPKEGGLVLRAPFTVVNEAGQEVFKLEAEGTRVELSVGVGEVGVSMETAGQDGAKLEVAGGIDHSIELNAGPAATELAISQGSSAEVTLGFLDLGKTGIEISAGDETVFEVSTGGDGTSLTVGEENGEQAKLEAGEEASLTLGQGEEPAVALTAQGEGGELTIGKGAEALVSLSATADEGKLELGGGEAAALLSGKGEIGTLQLGKEGSKLAKLTSEGTGGTLELSDGGEPSVTLEAGADGGKLGLGVGGEPTLTLTGKSAGGQILAGEPEGKRMQIGIGDAGDPVMQVADGEKRAALVVSGDTTGVVIATPDGASVLGTGSNGWGLQFSKQGTEMAMLGTHKGEKFGLTLFSNNAPTTALKAENDGGKLTFGVGENAKVKLSSNDIGGQLELGRSDSTRVQIGTVNGDAVVQVAKGNERAYLTVSADQVGIMASTSEGFAELGKNSKGFGYMLSKQGQSMANFGTYEGRSVAVRVFNQGTQIAAIGQGPDGGGTMRVFPTGGGSSFAQIDAFASGGYVGAFMPNGSPAAALDATERVVAVYNDGAVPVATLGLGSNGSGGNVTARDSGGSGVFSAGSATDGGGEACVIRQNGKIHCLGIGLPGMGSGN